MPPTSCFWVMRERADFAKHALQKKKKKKKKTQNVFDDFRSDFRWVSKKQKHYRNR